MKYTIAILVAICYGIAGFSQTVSVKLGIEWQKEKHPFLGWRNHEIPYLTVTYKNDMEYPIYFFNGKRDWEYPEVGFVSLINTRLTDSELAYFYSNYKEEKFIVKMDDPYFEILSIENIKDTIDEIFDFINDDIFYIHVAIEEKKKRQYIDTTFKAMLVDEDKIQNAYRDYFLFLKPGETHTNRFNLAAFQMVGGEFVFIPINDSITNNNFYTRRYWRTQPQKEKKLPEKVGDYYLYEGKLVSTDSVKIKFDGIPRDEKKVKKLSKEAEKRRARDMKRWK